MRGWLFLLLLSPLLVSAGTPDLREVDLHQAYGVTQRWDNVEQSPAWMSGISPQKRLGEKLHTIHLEPGQWTEVQLSANALLRLHPVAADAGKTPLLFEVSSGTGLYVRQQPQSLPDGGLLLDARHTTAYRVRISLDAGAERDFAFALFSSRLVELPVIEPYRYREAIGTEKEHVRYAGDIGAQLFNRVSGGESLVIPVEGPARYQLQQRLLLADKAPGPRNYQLHYQLDDGTMQVVDAAVSAARRRQLLLNGEPVSASNLRNDYIDIPQGAHRLRLQFSEDVLLRILKSIPDDYLLPDLNAPVHRYRVPPASDPWSLTPQQVQAALQPASPLQTVQQTILRIIADNRRQGGGLVGPMTLMDIARSQPDMPTLRTEAQVLLNRHSYYDDLLPATAHGESRVSRFAVRRLHGPQDGTDLYLMNAAERGRLAQRLDKAWFTDIIGQDEITFHLPQRPADSLLRVVILGDEPAASLQLFMDERPPLQLRLDRKTAADPVHFAVNAAGSLAVQAATADSDGSWQLPVRQTRPASALELHLPHDVKIIRIQRKDKSQQPLSLAMQYRAARPYRLSDTSYLQLLATLREESALQALWRACLADLDTALDPDTQIPDQLRIDQPLSKDARSAARAVVNHWVPLLRRLRARQESYRAGIDPDWRPAQRTLTSNELNTLLAAAKRAEHAGHWLPALEYWRRLSESRQAQHRQAALSGMLRALLKLGEYPLAERLLRGSYLNDTPANLQMQRFEQARTLYRQQNNSIALEGLLATALSRSPDPQLLSELAVQLVDAGRVQDALTVGMLLPAGHRPDTRLLAGAVQQQAWPALEHLLGNIDNATERSLWKGYRAWMLDDLEAARQHWQAAGSVGLTLIEKSHQGQQILDALLHADTAQQATTSRQLAGWLQQLPGPRNWQPATRLARSKAGMAWLYSPALDLGFNTLRTRPGQPVQLRITGPVRLRFDIQPLHEHDRDLPLDGWLQIQDGPRTWISPFTGNRASTGLLWPGGELRPGRIEKRELVLPAGMHQLEIQGIEHEFLLRLYLEAPLLNAGLSSPEALQPGPAADWRALARGITCSDIYKNDFVDCRTGKDTLPVGEPQHRHTVTPGAATTPRPDPVISRWQRTRPAPLQPLTRMQQDNDHPAGRPIPYRNMVTLLWQLEKNDADANTVIAQMEEQAKAVQEQPTASFLRPLLKRATRGADWQVIDYVPESAGVRYVERPVNAPQSPALRARAALLDSACSGSRLLSGHDELVYTLYNLKPAALRVELIPCNLPYQARSPIQVQVTNNGTRETPLSLSAASGARSLKIRTGRGEQIIRLRMLDPAVNQFLGVRIHDPSVPRQDSEEHVYHLATHDEPLRFDIEGPAWVRVDELHDDMSFSRYMSIDAGWQSVLLRPEKGRDEALYRLYRRSAGTPPPASRLSQANDTATPVPPAFRTGLPARTPSPLNDDYALGGQEDGTPSIGLRLVSRTRVDDEEESRRSRFREDFAELRGEYRYFDADNRRYWRSEILGRLREDGNPVAGFGQHLYNWPMPRWPRLQTSAHVTGFVQSPGDELPGRDGGTEWTVNANLRTLQHIPLGPRTYHEPAVTLFGRAMSMSRNDRYAGSSLDRDVFSRYKAQHKRGVRLSEYLLHKPWIDTEWYGQLSVTSNEDFNIASPDNLETRFGWRQLVGELDVDAGYRLRHYLSDSDRDNNSTRNDLRLKLSWMRRDILQRRGEVRLFMNYDIDNSESSAFLGLFLHGGNGRGLRDFRNGEVRFPAIRQRNAPHSANRVSQP
ncbi:MAG TPA: hypothetical protein ENJ80_13885 [Gammaproteobacteria bacterium]|nr:hypothetical protein [Gammaproteobacteria bacterium]